MKRRCTTESQVETFLQEAMDMGEKWTGIRRLPSPAWSFPLPCLLHYPSPIAHPDWQWHSIFLEEVDDLKERGD